MIIFSDPIFCGPGILFQTPPHPNPVFRFWSLIGYYKILSRVPCAIHRSFLMIYFIYSVIITILNDCFCHPLQPIFPYYINNQELLLLSCFSRVQLCATPETAAHQAPPSLEFSRQEHLSGLPFPSPTHESEK